MKYEGLLVKPQLENKPDGFYISGTCFYYPVDNKQSKQTDKIKLGPYKIESEAIENLKKYFASKEIQLTKNSQESLDKLLSKPQATQPIAQKIEEKVDFEYEGVLFSRDEPRQDGIYVTAVCVYFDKDFNINTLNLKTKGPYKTQEEYLNGARDEIKNKKIKLIKKPLEEILKDLGIDLEKEAKKNKRSLDEKVA